MFHFLSAISLLPSVYSCIATSSPEGLSVTCPSGYTYFATTGYCYAVKTGSGLAILQNDAEAACVADGGHLASIHSQAENDFLFGLAKTGSLIGVAIQPWIGLEQTTNELGPFPLGTCGASFQWTDATTVDYGPIWYGSSLGIPANPTCTLSILGCTLFIADSLPAPFNILTPNGEWFQFPCATLLATRYICKRLPL